MFNCLNSIHFNLSGMFTTHFFIFIESICYFAFVISYHDWNSEIPHQGSFLTSVKVSFSKSWWSIMNNLRFNCLNLFFPICHPLFLSLKIYMLLNISSLVNSKQVKQKHTLGMHEGVTLTRTHHSIYIFLHWKCFVFCNIK